MKFSNVCKKFQSSLRENKTVFLLCAILIICVIISLAVIMGRKKSVPENGRYARIYQNGTIIRTIDLSAVEEPYQFTICGADGEEKYDRSKERRNRYDLCKLQGSDMCKDGIHPFCSDARDLSSESYCD